jgi:DNA-directed RNA polymerase specialized sigma24 family protein
MSLYATAVERMLIEVVLRRRRVVSPITRQYPFKPFEVRGRTVSLAARVNGNTDDRDERETLERVIAEIAELPPTQRAVIYMRDVCGLTSEEVCERLAIGEAAQRARLHDARNRVRQAIFGADH